MEVIRALGIFVLAGLCEIGGGYLVWLWLREGKPMWYGLLGGVILFIYGIIATWQPSDFGRVYAAYGGIFIIMSIVWAWGLDNFKPDRYDIIGSIITLIGVFIIFFLPRS